MNISIIEILFFLIVAAIFGSLGARLAGQRAGGCLVAIVLGAVGAGVGWFIATRTNLAVITVELFDRHIPILWSIAGSALFVAVLSALTRKKRKKRD